MIGGEAEGIRRLVLEGCDQVVRIPMEGSVASLNAAAAGTVVLYEALRQRRRNVAPADTRTPPPARTAVTPQEQGMGDLDEEAEDELDDLAQANGDIDDGSVEREDGEVLMEDAADGAISDESDAADDADDPMEDAPAEVVVEAPKKRATRAKKTTTAKKPTVRKRASE